jgi:hypothetical protein
VGLLGLEDGQPSFAQALLVLGGARLGSRQIRPRLLDGALSLAATLRQDPGQGPMDHHGVQPVQQQQKDRRGHGPEQ